MAKTNLPQRQPAAVKVASPTGVRAGTKAKFIPRDPKDGEVMLILTRPQSGPYTFQEYARGDLIEHQGARVNGLDRAWITPSVLGGAYLAAQTGNADTLPLLADALEDAGCTNAEVLALLRNRTSGGWVGKIISTVTQSYVVVATKPGYTRSGEGWKVWEQIVVARLATDADHEAVAEQKATHEAETQRVMDRMMNS
jgi:hypothetical protein